jgi:hypothetical protein
MKQKSMDLSVAKARAAKAAEEKAKQDKLLKAPRDPHPDSHSGSR